MKNYRNHSKEEPDHHKVSLLFGGEICDICGQVWNEDGWVIRGGK